MYILILATVILLTVWIIEYYRHHHHVLKIPVRIHVNGTRGKSSVTRLIAAGLRAGNVKTIAKTTGTMPRVILEDGKETHIVRLEGANIIEQKYVFRFASKRNPDAIVIECMAVNPEYQWVTEREFVNSTISVITNARPDHLDVMGPTLDDVTKSLCNTIPENGICFTSEEPQFDVMNSVAKRRHTELRRSDNKVITKKMLDGFSYIEHADNVALSLDVCSHCGVDRDVALQGMQKAIPDPGALTRDKVSDKGKSIYFYNVFAANDPESSKQIWHMITDGLSDVEKIVILNGRADRYFRSVQLADICPDLGFDYLFLTGERTTALETYCYSLGMPKEKVIRIGEIPPEEVYNKIFDFTKREAHIVGIGNIAGKNNYGNQIVQYFNYKSKGGK